MSSAKCCLFIQSQWCKRNSMLPQKYHSYTNSISLATCHIRIATRHRTFSIWGSLIIVWIIYRCRYFMGTIAHLHVIWMWSGTLPVYTLFKRQGRLRLHTNDMKLNYWQYWWRKQHMPNHTGKGYLFFLNSILRAKFHYHWERLCYHRSFFTPCATTSSRILICAANFPRSQTRSGSRWSRTQPRAFPWHIIWRH